MVCGLLQVLDSSVELRYTPSIDLWLESSEERENWVGILFNPWFKNPSSNIGQFEKRKRGHVWGHFSQDGYNIFYPVPIIL